MSALYSPLTLAIATTILALAAARFSRHMLLSALLLMLLVLLGLATPLGANLLVRAVEAEIPAEPRSMLDACPAAESIVFLSGGFRRSPRDANDFGALTSETLDRVLALQTSKPPGQLPLVVSGGGPFQIPEAEVIVSLIRTLELGPRALHAESRSTNTRTSAVEVARLVPPSRRSIILATSALHLPRAAWTFRNAGFEVCPWPLNSRYVQVGTPAGLLPQTSALDKSERALHELLGQVYYRLTL